MNQIRNTGGVSYKKGIVVEAKPGFAKVRFAELDELVTHWLPVIHAKTQEDKFIWTLDAGEHVACLMDEHLEDGCIVGAIYSEADAPPVSSADKFRVQFKDGGSFEYDRSTGAMNVVSKSIATVRATTKVIVDSPDVEFTGNVLVRKTLTYEGGLVGSGSAPGAGGKSAAIQGSLQIVGGDVVADDISLKHHKNSGVVRGTDMSGEAAP
jgi:phage baseplate assembly protein V